MTDVTIIGGGPAGSASAIRLARLGLRVRLYEQKRFPRPKLCGGFLSPETRVSLSELGVLQDVIAAGAYPIRRIVIATPSGTEAETTLPLPAFSFPRAELDHLLLSEAKHLGVQVIEGVDGYARPSDSEWLVIAAGRAARTPGERRMEPRISDRRWLQRFSVRPGQAYYGLQAAFEGVSGVTDQVELDLMPGAYVGLARQDNRLVNVCALVTQSRMRDTGPALDRVLRTCLQENPVLAKRLNGASRVSPWQAVGPVRMGLRRLADGRRLFVGDAACVVDPFVGEGIAMALHGSRLLADAFEQTGAPIGQAYEERWRSTFSDALPVGHLLRLAMGNRFCQEVLASGLKRFPGALLWLTERTRPHARALLA